MKQALAMLAALAATAAAHGFGDATPFTCPGNTDNECTAEQKTGFHFDDVPDGIVDFIDGFHFRGFTCEGGRSKRYDARSAGRYIGGSCSSDRESSPSFGCGSRSGVDKFSLGSIHVRPEFDCELEFHYDMPDGSSCKHRNSCSSSGTTVYNRQCGGARNVTIVYPSQPSKPKSTCSVHVSTVSFSCGHSSTAPAKTRTTGVPGSSSAPPASPTTGTSTTGTSTTGTSTTGTSTTGTSTTQIRTIQTSTSQTGTTQTSTTQTKATQTSATQTSPSPTGTSQASTTQTTAIQTSTTTGQVGTTYSTSQSTVTGPPASWSASISVPASVGNLSLSTSTYVTSYLSVSTVYTTSTSTILSCAAAVTDCPASRGNVSTTLVVVAVSTTVCPVTETRTSVRTTHDASHPTAQPSQHPAHPSQPTSQPSSASSVASYSSLPGSQAAPSTAASSATQPGPEPTSTAETSSLLPSPSVVPSSLPDSTVAPSSPGVPSTQNPGPAYNTSSTAVVSQASSTSSIGPVEASTLPCPGVVPSCLNTFLYNTACADNSDAACYCPDSVFVTDAFDCIYAHGASDEIITEAISFLQGLCAPYASSNPAIATGATVTSYVSATATAANAAAPVYTTLTVVATTVVPCTDAAGSAIPSSSSTVVVSAALTVPQVGFATGSDNVVAVVPVTAEPTAYPTATGSGPAPAPTTATATTAAPVGTAVPVGTVWSTHAAPQPSATGFVPTNAGGRFGTRLGLAIAAVGVVAAL